MELPEAPPMKEFKPANGNLPILKDYRGDKSNNYWQHWVKRSYDELTPATSWICANKLLDVARDLDYMDQHGLLRRTMEILNTGAYRKDSDKPGTPASVNSGIDIVIFQQPKPS